MNTPLSNGSRFIEEFVNTWNKLCEGRPWIPTMDLPEFPEDILQELIEDFERLAELPMPDPSKPTPVYVSRMHFSEWAERLKKAMQLLEDYGPITLEEKD